jgi:hypothetical protein
MNVSPDSSVKCRCGRPTYLVPGHDHLRTCSLCGYLTSYCKCKKAKEVVVSLMNFGSPWVTDRTRAALGAAVFSSLGTLLVVSMFFSPFVGLLGIGMPLGLSSGFYVKWITEEQPSIAYSRSSGSGGPNLVNSS